MVVLSGAPELVQAKSNAEKISPCPPLIPYWRQAEGKKKLAQAYAGVLEIKTLSPESVKSHAALISPKKEKEAAELERDSSSPDLTCNTKNKTALKRQEISKVLDENNKLYVTTFVKPEAAQFTAYNELLTSLDSDSKDASPLLIERLKQATSGTAPSCEPLPGQRHWDLALRANAAFEKARKRAVDNQVYWIYRYLVAIKREPQRHSDDLTFVESLIARLDLIKYEAVQVRADQDYLMRTISLAESLKAALVSGSKVLCSPQVPTQKKPATPEAKIEKNI